MIKEFFEKLIQKKDLEAKKKSEANISDVDDYGVNNQFIIQVVEDKTDKIQQEIDQKKKELEKIINNNLN